MSELLPAVPSVSEAWLLSLERAAAAPDGRAVNVVSTVTEPGAEIDHVRRVIDGTLLAVGAQEVQTVAETIFPVSLYPDPGLDWSPELGRPERDLLDQSAACLYETYVGMLPLLLTISANSRGTYFSRMITWPGKESGGVNQLAARIKRLRAEHTADRYTHNALDIDVAADAGPGGEDLSGLQVYAATDRRIRGFPCLTHIDLTLYQGQLHMVAVYRHQYLIEKAYGNLLGLSWLLQFLCQQTGYTTGELVVHATLADSQGRPEALALAREARDAAQSSALTLAAGRP
jgi:hypothetical protein